MCAFSCPPRRPLSAQGVIYLSDVNFSDTNSLRNSSLLSLRICRFCLRPKLLQIAEWERKKCKFRGGHWLRTIARITESFRWRCSARTRSPNRTSSELMRLLERYKHDKAENKIIKRTDLFYHEYLFGQSFLSPHTILCSACFRLFRM